jgi:hypothetical protein
VAYFDWLGSHECEDRERDGDDSSTSDPKSRLAATSVRFHTKYVREDNAAIWRGTYRDGTTALSVKTANCEPLLALTVSLEAYDDFPADGNVFVKSWSENTGVFEALHAGRIVGDVIRSIPLAGRDEAYECRLLI